MTSGSARFYAGFLAVFLAVLLLSFDEAQALPQYAVSASSTCDTCHIEPLGWYNPDMSQRRCTLDCVACHVSPAGGGMRTSDGIYYGREVLPIWGDRPSSYGNPERYRPRGYPKKGVYKLGEGFSGWWPGPYDHNTIEDRYGDIEARPTWRVGGDFRAMFLTQSENEDSPFIFPMQADLYAMNESAQDLIFYVDIGLQGQKDVDNFENVEKRDYFTIREIFMKYRLPYNSYVRFGRIIPRYGWRVDDHTAYIREDLGYNQFFSAMGVDVGYNPNYLYADASFYYQGLDRWPGERLERGIGTTANVGYRDLGWQVGSSFGYLDRFDGFDQINGGVQWAVNLNPFVYIGEFDFRRLISPSDEFDSVNGLIAYHEFNYQITRGVYGKFKYDWADPNIDRLDDHKHRAQVAMDIHPYTYVDIETGYRLNWTPRVDFTDIASSEFFIIVHAWF